MPAKLFTLLNELPRDYKSDIYPRFYLKYNDSIHLDEASLGLLVRKEGEEVIYYEDSPDNSEELSKQVAHCAFMINDWIRTYYGWDTEQMRKELDSLINQLSRK